MNGYLVPANAKKGTLYFNMFRAFDLWLLGGGVGLTLFMLGVFPSTNLALTTIYLLPGIIAGILVFPIPNYHNVLCAILSIYNFYTLRRNYVWKGWCFYGKFGDDSKKSR